MPLYLVWSGCLMALMGPRGPRGPRGLSLSLGLLLERVADHCAACLDAHCAVCVGARALDADAGVHNLLEDTAVDDPAVVQTDELAVCDAVILVWLEQEQVRVLCASQGRGLVLHVQHVCVLRFGDMRRRQTVRVARRKLQRVGVLVVVGQVVRERVGGDGCAVAVRPWWSRGHSCWSGWRRGRQGDVGGLEGRCRCRRAGKRQLVGKEGGLFHDLRLAVAVSNGGRRRFQIPLLTVTGNDLRSALLSLDAGRLGVRLTLRERVCRGDCIPGMVCGGSDWGFR